MAHYQTANTCNIEFLKSSKGFGSRIIKLNYNESAIPPQLVGRIDNVSAARPGRVIRDDDLERPAT